MGKLVDLMGRAFGRLLVIDRAGSSGNHAAWKCLCDPTRGGCGQVKKVVGKDLRSGHTMSCGCLAREAPQFVTHGACRKRARTSEWNVWSGIIKRCEDPANKAFHNYGGRGIRICAEWRHDFAAFLAHVGRRPSRGHSIDRIDNARGYEPGNVRWSTNAEQTRNTRRSVLLTIDGVTMCVADWSKFGPVKRQAIHDRLRKGMSHKDAVFSPPSRGTATAQVLARSGQVAETEGGR